MRTAKLEIYRDAKREWRWRLRAANGRIVADSGEGYRRRTAAYEAVHRLKSILAGDVPVLEAKP